MTKQRTTQPTSDKDNFYEAMPTAADHYVYRDETSASEPEQMVESEAKLISLITLVLVTVAVIALAALFIQGFNMIRGA